MPSSPVVVRVERWKLPSRVTSTPSPGARLLPVGLERVVLGSAPATKTSKPHGWPEVEVSQAVVIVQWPPAAYWTNTPTPVPPGEVRVAPVSIATVSGLAVIVSSGGAVPGPTCQVSAPSLQPPRAQERAPAQRRRADTERSVMEDKRRIT